MLCPYCVSEIADQALVCPVCRRDFYLFRPLLERIGKLEEELAAHRQLLVERLPAPAALAPSTPVAEPPPLPSEEPRVRPRIREWLALWLLPLAALLVAHGLITVVYDLHTLYLRIASLLIPLPFGILLTAHERRPPLTVTLATVLFAGLAVVGMSGTTAWVDGTPVWPQGLREWREFLEYAASIGFSYTTGMLIGRLSRLRGRAAALREAGMATALANLVKAGGERTEQFQSAVKKFNELGGVLAAAATTVASAYTGLQGFIGK